jgi:hypothetical protein
MSRVGQRGQATVETVGVTVLVALLLAGTSAWLVRAVHPPERPPAFVEAVSKPLVRDPAPFEFRYPLPRPFTMPRGRDDEPIGRALRALAGGARDGLLFGHELQAAFGLAYAERLRERGEQLLRDPLGGLGVVADPDLLRPESYAQDAVRDAERLRDYIAALRSMSPREAALRVSGDLGSFGADLSIEAAEVLLRKRLQRTGQREPAP